MNMKTEKVNYVLQALHKERIDNLTKEALVKAFNDDGIFDLEGIAEHMLKRIKKDIENQLTEPRLIDFAPLGKRTTKDLARSITHATPEVPFVLDGIAYEPEDIRRFDGQALVFIPTVAADGSTYLQLFDEKIGEVIASYFQVRQLAALIKPSDFNIPGLPPPTPPGTPPGQPPSGPPVLVGCGYPGLPPCGQSQQPPPGPTPPPREPNPPVTWGQVQMFDDADYQGNWLWLAKGYMWNDLTRVSRGGFFGGDWNDAISSLSATNTSCIYCEHINLEGSKLLVGPNTQKHNLEVFGWNDRISSVWNFDS
jgi:hypothetical protein